MRQGVPEPLPYRELDKVRDWSAVQCLHAVRGQHPLTVPDTEK